MHDPGGQTRAAGLSACVLDALGSSASHWLSKVQVGRLPLLGFCDVHFS